MTVSAMSTVANPTNVLALAAAVLLLIFAISLAFVVPDPGPRGASEIQFGPYP
jgi:hypothetical protein